MYGTPKVSPRGSFAWGLALAALVCCNLAGMPGAARAERKQAAMAIDANTGDVLYAQAADEPRRPASLTKMMTLYIAFGEIEAGRLNYGSSIEISAAAAAVAPSKLDLDPGSRITLIDAIKSLITKSANDVAVAIAERIAGSEAAFARLMTERARQIGMRATTFENASGLPANGQTTTARDMLTLALRLHDDYPKHYRLFSLRYFSYNGDTHRNHNTLLFNYAGTEGIKTGYTRASGFNLVTSVKRDGKHIVAAVFGGETAGTRNTHMRSMLSRAFAKASTVKTRKPAPMLVARPKPAPRPTKEVALKSEPRPAARPARPAQAQVAAPTPASQPKKPEAPAAAVEPAIPHPFEVAVVKVRPAAPPSAGPEPAHTSAMLAAAVAPKLDFAATREALASPRFSAFAPAPTSPPAETETIIAKSSRESGVRAPGTLDQQLALISSTPPPLPALAPRPVAAAATPRPQLAVAPAQIARGTPPSTLAEQAAKLARSQAAAPAAAKPNHLGGPNSDAGFEIQIGAFASPEEAEARLAMVQSKTATVSGHPALALPATDGGRQIYRARFAGFDPDKATATCLELRRAAIDCFVTRAE